MEASFPPDGAPARSQPSLQLNQAASSQAGTLNMITGMTAMQSGRSAAGNEVTTVDSAPSQAVGVRSGFWEVQVDNYRRFKGSDAS